MNSKVVTLGAKPSGFLSHRGFIVPLAPLQRYLGDNWKAFLNKLTLLYRPKIGPVVRTQMYEMIVLEADGSTRRVPPGQAKCILLPRSLITSGIFGKVEVMFSPKSRIVCDGLDQIMAEAVSRLYDNQLLIVNHLMKHIFTAWRQDEGLASAILNLRAGMGKTWVAAGLIALLKYRTLYIVPKLPLAVQSTNDLRALFEDRIVIRKYNAAATKKWDAKVKAGKAEPRVPDDVTVMVINSAIMQPPEFFQQYSLIILDEVDTFCSPCRRAIFDRPTYCVLGMSATTADRSDGTHAIAHKALATTPSPANRRDHPVECDYITRGGVIHAEDIPGFTYEDVIFESKVDVIRYKGPDDRTQHLTHLSTGRMFTPYMNEQFLSDPWRMQLAVNELRALYDWRGDQGQMHSIYVFCEERDPLKTVYDLFVASFGEGDILAPELVNDNSSAAGGVGHFIGGIKEAQVNGIKLHARIILTTYGYSGTGVSIDRATAIIFLTPRRANMKQILARILRRSGDLSIVRRVIDIVDQETGIRNQYADRAQAYAFYGMEVDQRKISWTDISIAA